MFVIADMILAIAIIAIAPGTIAEFQVRVGCIRPAADGAAMVIGSFWGGHRGLIRTGGGEGDDAGLLLGGGGFLFLLK